MRKHAKYDALIYACHALAPVRTAVVHPCDETSLRAAFEAAEAKIIRPLLIGPEARNKSGHFDPSHFEDRYENALIDLRSFDTDQCATCDPVIGITGAPF